MATSVLVIRHTVSCTELNWHCMVRFSGESVWNLVLERTAHCRSRCYERRHWQSPGNYCNYAFIICPI